MAEDQFKRKLTTILSGDVESYSRQMDEDEAATAKAFESCRKILGDLVKQSPITAFEKEDLLPIRITCLYK